MRWARIAAAAAGAAAVVAGALTASPATSRPAASQRGPAVLIRPDALHAAGVLTAPPSTAYCERHFGIACYTAGQIEQAYNLPALYHRGITGKGQTIVIVDSFGSPTVAHDLAVFDQAAGLPAPPSLRVIQPAGPVPRYRATSNREGWAGETDLDVEYAHDIAPGAGILVVETPTSENEGTTGFPQIVTAEEAVIRRHLGGVISQSFSATEQTFASRAALLGLRGAYTAAAAAGVTVLAASGDSGAADVKFNGSTFYLRPVTSWPDSDPLVTGVGGTQLHLAAAGRPGPATVWNDTFNRNANEFVNGSAGPSPLAGGGGTSVMFRRPAYQDGVARVTGGRRGVPDISMSAACDGAVDLYQSFAGQPAGWYPTCGTSEATPEFAGIVTLAAQLAGHPLGQINPALYRMLAAGDPGLVDVTSGTNTVAGEQGGRRFTVQGFAARRGYDLASGAGTVNGALFVPELAAAAGRPGWDWPRMWAGTATAGLTGGTAPTPRPGV
jgi:subtilase family serine protease